MTIAFPYNYLSNSCRLLEIPLINCKVELKLRWAKYCVLSADNELSNNIVFDIKGTKLYAPVSTLSSKDKTIKAS